MPKRGKVFEKGVDMAKVNWTKIKTEYITGNISQRNLAEKHGVSSSTLCKIAQAEKWTAAREKHRQKIVEKAIQKTADEQAERIKDQLLTAAAMVGVMDKALKDPQQFNRYIVSEGLGEGVSETVEKIFSKTDFRALKDAAAALQNVVKVQKDILAMDRIVDQKERERLEIERSKTNVIDDDDSETGVVMLAPVLDDTDDDDEEDGDDE